MLIPEHVVESLGAKQKVLKEGSAELRIYDFLNQGVYAQTKEFPRFALFVRVAPQRYMPAMHTTKGRAGDLTQVGLEPLWRLVTQSADYAELVEAGMMWLAGWRAQSASSLGVGR